MQHENRLSSLAREGRTVVERRGAGAARDVRAGSDHAAGGAGPPRPLGCGLGGLDWEVVRPRIEQAAGQLVDTRVLVYEPV